MRPQGIPPYPPPQPMPPQQSQAHPQPYFPPASAYPPPTNTPSQPAQLVRPAPLYPHPRPPPPLQTSQSPSPTPYYLASPSSLSGARSPPPPIPGPPPQPSPYSHPPPSSVAPFPYPRAPLPPSNLLSPSASSPASSAASPTHSTLHPYTFPLPSPTSSAPHLPSPSSSNPQISTSTLPHRPPPLALPTSSSPPPQPPGVLATDEGPLSVPQSAGASPAGQHRGHFYPAMGSMNGMARTQSYMSPTGDYSAFPQQARSMRAPQPQYAQANQPMPQLPQSYPPPPMPSQPQYQPTGQPGPPMPQPGYPQSYPDPASAYPPPSQYPPAPSQYAAAPSQYSTAPSLPPRFAWVKPVSPAYMQTASSYFPDTPELFDACQLPFGVFMRPLGPGLSLPVSPSNPYPDPQASPSGLTSPLSPSPYPPPSSSPPAIPIVRPGQAGVIRCKECKAYINGYVTWLDQGRQWKCNICLTDNPTPAAYFSPLSSEGRRLDWDEREELKNASYELYAPKDYMVRAPVPPLVCLAIDVSQQAQRGGMLADVCATVLGLLDVLAMHPKALLSVVTFSDQVHYYTIQTKDKRASMHVLSTLDDLFLPSPIGLLIRVADCKEQLVALFQSLPAIHARPEPSPLCTASALECCMMIMGRYGGRLLCFVSSFTGVGRGLMTDREREVVEKAKGGEGVEGQLLKPGSDYYKKLSETMQKHQITCDLFFFPPSFTPTSAPFYCDVTTYSDLARYTGGQLYYYPHYSTTSTPSLHSTLHSLLTRPQCFESVFRVRVSKGIQISDFHGHFSIRGQDLLSLPCVDSEKGVSFELKLDEKEKGQVVGSKDRVVVVQTGLLYTSYIGERRIVVHTLVIPVAKEVRRVMEGMQVEVCVGLISKRAVWLAYAHSLNQARQFVRQKCGSVVRAWQKGQITPPQSEGLVAYQAEASFSTLCLFLLKSCFGEQGAVFISPDQRAYLLSTLYVLPLPDTIRLIYPTLIPLHWLPHDPRYGCIDPSTSSLLVPNSLPLTRASLTPDSVLLLHNAVSTVVRVGGYADQSLVSVMVEEEGGGWRLRGRETSEVMGRVWAVVDEVRRVSGLMSRVQVVREGDAMDAMVQSLMVEDQRGQEPGVREWEALMR